MESTKIKDYALKITNATPGRLTIISYELLIDYINELKEYIDQKETNKFYVAMKTTEKILNELKDSLDMSYDIASELMNLYLFVQSKLSQASIKFSIEPLQEAEKVLQILLVGWEEAFKEEKQSKIMKNTQQVYAGLTYGKGVLNESLTNNTGRGFKA